MQHDPRRADLLPPLLAALGPAQVVADPGASDPQRSPWRCYRACLQALEPDATHLVIVQDDAQPCLDVPAALELVIAARPDDVIALFVPGIGEHARRVLEACYHGKHWCHLFEHLFCPAVAMVYPRERVREILAFVAAKNYPASLTADDAILGYWMRETHTRVLGCVPSLVEHPDTVPSLVGTHHMSGVNPARVAACWTGPDFSPLELDWRA